MLFGLPVAAVIRWTIRCPYGPFESCAIHRCAFSHHIMHGCLMREACKPYIHCASPQQAPCIKRVPQISLLEHSTLGHYAVICCDIFSFFFGHRGEAVYLSAKSQETPEEPGMCTNNDLIYASWSLPCLLGRLRLRFRSPGSASAATDASSRFWRLASAVLSLALVLSPSTPAAAPQCLVLWHIATFPCDGLI